MIPSLIWDDIEDRCLSYFNEGFAKFTGKAYSDEVMKAIVFASSAAQRCHDFASKVIVRTKKPPTLIMKDD